MCGKRLAQISYTLASDFLFLLSTQQTFFNIFTLKFSIMKKTFLLLTALLCVTFLYAQKDKHRNKKTDNLEPILEIFPITPPIEHFGKYEPIIPEDAPRTNEEIFTRAELVFEGIRLNCLATYDTKGNRNRYDMYGIVAYKINKVYKGDQALTGNTVYVVEQGIGLGAEKISLDMYDIEYDTPLCLGVSSASWSTIYFFTTSDYPENGIPNQYTNIKKYKILEKAFDDLYVQGDRICGLNGLIFHQHEDFYNYIMQFEGYTVPEIPKEPELKWINGAELDGAILAPERYENMKVLMESMQYEIDKSQKKHSKKNQRKSKKHRF
jgi:hypothetical protein